MSIMWSYLDKRRATVAALKRKDKTQLALINAVKANLKGSVVA